MSLVWATRGRDWGFRFLLTGGFSDPLLTYERAFSGLPAGEAAIQVIGGVLALRFMDPLDRRDRSGRPIPHEFVLTGPDVVQVRSVDDGIQKIWPLVADYYEEVWAESAAPSPHESLSD